MAISTLLTEGQMKIIVIGSGMSGLTAAAVCTQAGHQVEIFEQNDRPGGVTHTLAEDGYRWDLGQLLIEGMAPHEPVGRILSELGVTPLISIQKDDRGYVFPDFELRKPDQPAGKQWRMERLREIFPKEAAGIDRYWQEYIRFTRVMTAGRRMETSSGLERLLWQARLYGNLLPLLPKKDWSAQRLMDSFFKPIELQCVFISILADFFTSPRQFMGLGVYALNPEAVYDCRLPSELAPGAEQLYHYSVHGGIGELVEALVSRIQDCGGKIFTRRAVSKILVENGRVSGVVDDQGDTSVADVVIASGGAHETFLNLVGAEHLPSKFQADLQRISLMDSIFMIQLGVDYDPRPHCHGSCTYFYGNYDLDEAIGKIRQGHFHEGRDGYVIHLPTNHTPSMAPEGHHALTVYTIAPDKLKDGSWKDHKNEIADRFLACVEERLPGLRNHILKRIVLTPDDFRQIAYTDHHAFGAPGNRLTRPLSWGYGLSVRKANPAAELTIRSLVVIRPLGGFSPHKEKKGR
jgi:phytoene dehydrogenase-like protein